MTQAQLHRSVAGRTGDPARTVRRLGLQPCRPIGPEPEDLRLVVDCPFCGTAVPYSGRAGDGSAALAERIGARCDVCFDFDPVDVYARGGEEVA